MDYVIDTIKRLRALGKRLENMGCEDDALALYDIADDLVSAGVKELREAAEE